MPFSKFVEIGRAAQINRGSNEGKLVVILDVLNLNRILVEGADEKNMLERTVVPIKSLTLTDQKVGILRGVRSQLLKKTIKKEELLKNFNNSKLAQKQFKSAKRASLSDFDRFKVMVYKRQVSQIVKTKINKK